MPATIEALESKREEVEKGQPPHIDTGALCLHFLLSYHGIRSSPEQIYHDFAGAEGRLNLVALVRAARKNRLKAKATTIKLDRLAKLPLPAIAELNDDEFLIVAKVSAGEILVQRANNPPEVLTEAEFADQWSGGLLLLTRRASSMSAKFKFSPRWFVPVMAKYKKLFSEVLLASFFLQCFGLITPLFF